MVSRDIYARDLRRAKEALVAKVQYYSTLILDPIIGEENYTLHVSFEDMGINTEAEAIYYDEDNTYNMIFNDQLIEANMYNIDSRAFDGMIVHEDCHLKEFLQGNFVDRHTRTPSYKRCVLDTGVDKIWASHKTHGGVYSIRHYLGSTRGVVPIDILHIWSYYCPRENLKIVENVLNTTRKRIKFCLNCGAPVQALHFQPLTVHTYFTDEDIDLAY